METWRCINCGKKRDYEDDLIMIMCKCGFFMNNESNPDKGWETKNNEIK